MNSIQSIEMKSKVQNLVSQYGRSMHIYIFTYHFFSLQMQHMARITFLFFSICFLTGFVIAFALCLLLLGVLVTFGFTAIVRLAIDHQVALRVGGQTFGWWSKPPVTPVMRLYIYNVTNADEFLNNGTKPVLDELGPYVYT